MKKFLYTVIFIMIICQANCLSEITNALAQTLGSKYTKKTIVEKFTQMTPREWGPNVDARTRLATNQPVIALTFDAPGSKWAGYDVDLIKFLKKNKIPATLFLNARWLDLFPRLARKLSEDPLFEVANKGYRHLPLSVDGRMGKGKFGTNNVGEVYDEIELAARKIVQITGKKPKYFRSHFSYYDNVSAKIVEDLGYIPVGYSIDGDEATSIDKKEIKKRLLNAKQGDIIVCHMDRPDGDTAEAIKEVVPLLKRAGYRFVKLSDYPLE